MQTPEIFKLDKPITVYCVTAESFPDGLPKAFATLESVAPPSADRKNFGISWGGPTITYKAAVTELQKGELKDKGLEEFTIDAGNYLSIVVEGYTNIASAIQTLIKDPRIDPKGYCVEMYGDGQTVRCMVSMDKF